MIDRVRKRVALRRLRNGGIHVNLLVDQILNVSQSLFIFTQLDLSAPCSMLVERGKGGGHTFEVLYYYSRSEGTFPRSRERLFNDTPH